MPLLLVKFPGILFYLLFEERDFLAKSPIELLRFPPLSERVFGFQQVR